MSKNQSVRNKHKVLIGSGIALSAGVAIGVMFVLPAEMGFDPTGVGKATGILEISQPPSMTPELRRGMLRSGVLTVTEGSLTPEPGVTDRFEFELAPYEGIELKYTIEQDKAITFRWRATAPLSYDMHGHPFAGGEDLTESYSIDEAESMQGRYVAPFTGIHGWFWQNRSLEPVRLTLDASGGIAESRIFDTTGEHKRELVSVAEE